LYSTPTTSGVDHSESASTPVDADRWENFLRNVPPCDSIDEDDLEEHEEEAQPSPRKKPRVSLATVIAASDAQIIKPSSAAAADQQMAMTDVTAQPKDDTRSQQQQAADLCSDLDDRAASFKRLMKQCHVPDNAVSRARFQTYLMMAPELFIHKLLTWAPK